ncbi:hypothetical protein [Streptomyces sp. MUM 178J]|uniref:hypothetical protein n=1 Tax=Streptomyces sp. MUM 178J TaxID=2791991 RepID=UPI001F03AD57|nr:hypothetical protein [Streptomyces sp. MUM 178J]WRQ81880.1 hypothetical protein I3F59_022350 [Streptomyces sp. MUM 178J]
MRAAVVRRSAVAVSAVCLGLLATACSGSSDEENKSSGREAARSEKPAAAEGGGRPLTAAELEKIVLAQGDVKGHKVEKSSVAAAATPDGVKVDRAECEPLAHAMSGVKLGKPAATVTRQATQEPAEQKQDVSIEDMTEEEIQEQLAENFNLTSTLVGLAAYEGTGAEEVLASLRSAAKACSGGFTATMQGEKSKILKVEEIKVSGGQEAVAWSLTADLEDGDTMPTKLAVIRKDGTLARFVAVNFGGLINGKDFPLPTAVVDAQLAKLG